MFGLFKKTSWNINGKNLDFFRQVFTLLPSEYNFLIDGLEKGLYTKYSFNIRNLYIVHFDASLSHKLKNHDKQFELKNIIIEQNGIKYPLNLTIYNGLWIGFECQNNIREFHNYQIDLSGIKQKVSKFTKDGIIETLVNGLISEQFDFENLNKFEIEGNKYYQIKDFENGTYIVINKKGKVFKLNLDSKKAELISESVRMFVDKINNGQIDLVKYLNK